jgi:hypothetical protein
VDPLSRIAKLSIGIRRDLLRLLKAPPDIRADMIRQMHARTDTSGLAEVLMDLEADELIRLQVIALLEENT